MTTAENKVTSLEGGLTHTNKGLTNVTKRVTTLEGKVGKEGGIATLDVNGNVPLSQLGNIDTTLFVIA